MPVRLSRSVAFLSGAPVTLTTLPSREAFAAGVCAAQAAQNITAKTTLFAITRFYNNVFAGSYFPAIFSTGCFADGRLTPRIEAMVGATCRISTMPKSRPGATILPKTKNEARISGRSGK
jgi:hypothetical protein